MIKRLLHIIACVMAFCPAMAQYNLGIATGNWSGIYALSLNPANIADSRERFAIDIFSLNAGVNNSLGYINSNGGLISAINKGTTNSLFAYSSSSKFSLLAPYAQVHLPGVIISINHRHSIALTTGVRGFNQFNNFDQSLYKTITDPTYTPSSDIVLTSNQFNYTAHVWSEAGLTYAGVLLDQKEHELKVGVTLRYLGGIGYIGLKGHNLDAQYKQGSDSLFVKNSDLEFASNILSTRSAILNGVSNQSILSEFFGSKDGSGIGGDIGIVYEYMPEYERDCYMSKDGEQVKTDYSKNRYKLRLSASVMDIGAITYGSNINSNANVTGNGAISGADFSNNVHSFDEFRSYAVAHGFRADTSHQDTKVYMPTSLRVGADYRIYHGFYVNALFLANLADRRNFGNSYYNQFTLTPRYDTRLFSFGLPLTYDALSQTAKLGLGVRIAGFIIGSDDALALIAGHQSGVNFYIGGFVPFERTKPKGTFVERPAEAPQPGIEQKAPPTDTTGTEEDQEQSLVYPARNIRHFSEDGELKKGSSLAGYYIKGVLFDDKKGMSSKWEVQT